jgi:DNA-binding response OmpR family regulator
MRILIAEDDEALARFVRQGLEGEHYSVDVMPEGEQARTAATEFEYDVVILDLNLPKLDGVSVLRYLRSKKPTLPVLVLTQRTRVDDRVQFLDTGADDYLAKPFSFSELSVRIRALMRRSHLPSESVLVAADLRLDRVQRLVERAGRRIELTGKEFLLLEYLMLNAGRRVTRSMIIEHVCPNRPPSLAIAFVASREIRLAGCGPFLWVRLLRPSRPPLDLLLRSSQSDSVRAFPPVVLPRFPLPAPAPSEEM